MSRLLPQNSSSDPHSLGETASSNPTHIWIEPTNRCNTRCTHCAHYYSHFGQDMPKVVFEKITEALLTGAKSVDLIGYGEPLLAECFDNMLEMCLSRGIQVSISSNGILLRDDMRVARLVRSGVRIHLSIDGARAETFEFVRPFIKWQEMIETLECLKRNAGAAGAGKRFSLAFSFVAMRQNIADLPDLIRLASKYGAQTVYVLPLGQEDCRELVRDQSLDGAPELVSPVFLNALRVAARLGVELHVPAFFRGMIVNGPEREPGVETKLRRASRKAQLAFAYLRQRGLTSTLKQLSRSLVSRPRAGCSYCLYPWQRAYFSANGDVFPCCVMGETTGNMTTQTWEEIWNGPLYRNVRRTIHSWNPTAVCRYCVFPAGINGGDEKLRAKIFAKYHFEPVRIDSSSVQFREGFHEIERLEDGKPSHCWMGQTGLLWLPMPKKAGFLRFNIIPRSPILPDTNPGRCRINGGCWEPFDNTCPDITFPLGHVREERLRIEIEMENAPQAPGDPRRLGLAISGIHFLWPRDWMKWSLRLVRGSALAKPPGRNGNTRKPAEKAGPQETAPHLHNKKEGEHPRP